MASITPDLSQCPEKSGGVPQHEGVRLDSSSHSLTPHPQDTLGIFR